METAQTNELKTEKSFDVLASIRQYRYDLDAVGYIRDETRQRVFDEELSYIAEGINRPNYTEFTLQEIAGELVYFHNGAWRPYISTLVKGLETAGAEAAADPRKKFEAERRADDLKRGYQLQKLSLGEKLSWFYGFPREQLALYGEKFIGDMGFYPERAMGYLCEAEKTTDGRLVLRHQSVDNSDRQAFEAAMAISAAGGSIEDMTLAYDQALSRQNGGQYYAGRLLDQDVPEENAWIAVTRHQDLVDYLMGQVEAIARSGLSETETERAKKRLTYGVWARLKERLDEQSLGIDQYSPSYSGGGSIQAQVESAYSSATARGEVLFGCGGSISGEKTLLQASSKEVFSLIFGKGEKKWFGCHFCGTKQYGDPCASHLYCPACTAEVKNGKIVSTGKGRSPKKGFLDILLESFAESNQRYKAAQAAERQAKLKKAT